MTHRPPIRGDAQGWESSHSGPGRGQVLASGDGSEGRSLLPRPDGKGGRPLAAERSTPASTVRTDEYGLCVICGGHGAVIHGDRTNAYGRTVPNFVPCPHCCQRDLITPMMEARADG